MKILALDTSALSASVAVSEDMVVLGEFMTNYKKTHSERIMPMLDGLLSALGIKLADIDAFAVSIGPGSFTGLRIGISTVKAFAQTCAKPAVAIETTRMLAENIAYTPHIICPVMDARAGQVYNGLYRYKGESQETEVSARAIAVTDLISELLEKGEQVIFTGDGVPVYRERLLAELGDLARFAPPQCVMQRASSMLPLAYNMIQQGETCSAYDLAPLYLRKPQAEREREEKIKSKK